MQHLSIHHRNIISLKVIPSLGLIPFFLFCIAFEIVPIVILIRDSFISSNGIITFANYTALAKPVYLLSFWNSIKLSFLSALLATVFGTKWLQ